MQFFVNYLNQESLDTPSSLLIGPFSMFVIFFYLKLLYILVAIYLSLHYVHWKIGAFVGCGVVFFCACVNATANQQKRFEAKADRQTLWNKLIFGIMYHFSPAQPAQPVRLSFRSAIAGHIRQYLKTFQVEAIQFMHQYLTKGEFCIYNDESGLGKQAAVAVLLDAACSNKKCLIVVQNDDQFVTAWEFHFSVLAKLNVFVINGNKGEFYFMLFKNINSGTIVVHPGLLKKLICIRRFCFRCQSLLNFGLFLFFLLLVFRNQFAFHLSIWLVCCSRF